ncbi:Uncharacterised protein [Salmonella bongori]|nr:Uncharacterised protein [Salmonella bongori]
MERGNQRIMIKTRHAFKVMRQIFTFDIGIDVEQTTQNDTTQRVPSRANGT